jgi:hypothetical protein
METIVKTHQVQEFIAKGEHQAPFVPKEVAQKKS